MPKKPGRKRFLSVPREIHRGRLEIQEIFAFPPRWICLERFHLQLFCSGGIERENTVKQNRSITCKDLGLGITNYQPSASTPK